MRTVGSSRIRIAAVVAGIFTLADVDVSFSTLEGPVGTVVEFAGTDCPGPSEHLGMYLFEIPAPTGEGVLLGTYPIAQDGSSSGEFAIPTHLAGLQARTVTPGDYRLIGDCDNFALGEESFVRTVVVTAGTRRMTRPTPRMTETPRSRLPPKHPAVTVPWSCRPPR